MKKAGVLMPVFSLPSPYGIGTLGGAAREFVDFLVAGGQSYWQILPLGPTGPGDSPYQSCSTYAGNPYLIDLDDLTARQLLHPEEYQHLDWGTDGGAVDYQQLFTLRIPVLRLACTRLEEKEGPALVQFCREQGHWLEDYALFMALKEAHGGLSWLDWPDGVRLRDGQALARARNELARELAFWQGVQYLFFSQWWALKGYANGRGLSILGDLPIYVALDSADVWANPGQFQLDGQGYPTEVAGCPPDGFTTDGQLWGNPLFDWYKMCEDGYRWWLDRLAAQFHMYDALRIDHFRGFDAYYSIPYGAEHARVGRWQTGPGLPFFRAVEAKLGRREIIAEDLGFLTPSVHQLRMDMGYPGMKVLEFAFDSWDAGSDYLPHRYEPNCVVYAGTHDNNTILGWLTTAPEQQVAFAKAYLRLSECEGYHWGMMRAAWASPANLAVMQMQDILGLGGQARINTPATVGANWRWRLLPGQCTPELAGQLHREMQVYQRLPNRGQ